MIWTRTFPAFVIALISVLLVSGCASPSGNAMKESKHELRITGSDTMLQMVSGFAEAYKQTNSDSRISVTGGGSGAGISSLINKETEIADSSRKIKDSEIQSAKDKGIEVVEIPIAFDILSVAVNPKNSLDKLTIQQLSLIFSGNITNWKELGWQDKKITLYGRQSTSGTYTYFMEEVVKGDYSTQMRNMEGNQAIIDAIRQDSSGIGYVGVGYLEDESGTRVAGIKVISVSKNNTSEYINPLDEAKLDYYPISRNLYQYVSNGIGENSDLYKFLAFELSEEGQEIVKKSGFIPLKNVELEKAKEILVKSQ
jgi:phosphate transport system substrate-binding protein